MIIGILPNIPWVSYQQTYLCMSTYIPSILFFLLVYTLCGTIALRVSLSTKVLARVNKGLIQSIAFKTFVYLFIYGSRYA